MILKNPVTVVDLLEAGRCLDGVCKWILKHRGQISGDPRSFPDVGEIQRDSFADGYGYGDGYGDGYGYGYGYGDGYGDGDGSKNGDGGFET